MTPLNTTKKFTDSNYLPKNPGALGRSLFQGIVDEVVSYINGTITTELGLKALNTSVSSITASVTAVTNTSGGGWFKDKKTGYIHQWGTFNASGIGFVSFNIAFTSNPVVVISNEAGTSTAYNTITTSGFNVSGNGIVSWTADGK